MALSEQGLVLLEILFVYSLVLEAHSEGVEVLFDACLESCLE